MSKPNMGGSYAVVFEKYVLKVIKTIALKKNQEFYIGYEAGNRYRFLDGYAPNGLLDIKGSVAVEIKLRINADTLKRVIDRINSELPNIDNILIITKDISYNKSINSIKLPLNVEIWDENKLLGLLKAYSLDTEKFIFRPSFNSKSLKESETLEYNYNKILNIKNLRAAYERDELVLCLGSGVSKGAIGVGERGLPDWKELTKRLISKAIETNFSDKYIYDNIIESINESTNDFSQIALGRFIKTVFDKDNQFVKELRHALYLGYERKINVDASLNSIAKLCDPPRGRMGVFAIITYNYDDLLEYYLDEFNIKFYSIIQPNEIPSMNEIPIYHVHGFLPQDGTITPELEKSVIFGEFEYHNQYTDPYSWQNLLQLNLLREKTVLFIGLSMSDPNLRRLLDIAYKYSKNPKHYAILKDHWIMKDEGLSNMLRSMEERTFEELGINIIWYRDFSEINKIINDIRL